MFTTAYFVNELHDFVTHFKNYDRHRIAKGAVEAAVELCEAVKAKTKPQPPFEKIEDSLEDVLTELRHVRVDVLGLKGDFIDSDVEYTSDEDDEVEKAKTKSKSKSKTKAKDFRMTAQISLVSRFSSNLIHAVLIRSRPFIWLISQN